jgi:hypothetical protein
MGHGEHAASSLPKHNLPARRGRAGALGSALALATDAVRGDDQGDQETDGDGGLHHLRIISGTSIILTSTLLARVKE